MKLKSNNNQAFNVPNDETGRFFITLMGKYRNERWHYAARGRGSRKKHGDQRGIKCEHAEWLAVYLSQDTPRVDHYDRHLRERWDHYRMMMRVPRLINAPINFRNPGALS